MGQPILFFVSQEVPLVQSIGRRGTGSVLGFVFLQDRAFNSEAHMFYELAYVLAAPHVCYTPAPIDIKFAIWINVLISCLWVGLFLVQRIKSAHCVSVVAFEIQREAYGHSGSSGLREVKHCTGEVHPSVRYGTHLHDQPFGRTFTYVQQHVLPLGDVVHPGQQHSVDPVIVQQTSHVGVISLVELHWQVVLLCESVESFHKHSTWLNTHHVTGSMAMCHVTPQSVIATHVQHTLTPYSSFVAHYLMIIFHEHCVGRIEILHHGIRVRTPYVTCYVTQVAKVGVLIPDLSGP